MAYVTISEEAKPLYTIRRFTDRIYKIVRFKRSDGFATFVVADSDDDAAGGEKFDASLSRARRMVFEKALCNEWDYFFTGTLDGSKHDRFDLQDFHRQLTEFFKYRRRVYGTDLRFLLVPEKHEDGAWHVHGFVSGIPRTELCRFTREFFVGHGLNINYKLMKSDYLCWGDFFNKFGYCSLAPIRSVLGVSYYITKYISKDLSSRRDEVGEHLYYCSRGLKTAMKLCEIYQPMPVLDALCVNDYEYCSSGMFTDGDWLFAAEMLDAADFVTDISPDLFKPSEPDREEAVSIDNFVCENLRMKEFV